jgi:hypothetical protein
VAVHTKPKLLLGLLGVERVLGAPRAHASETTLTEMLSAGLACQLVSEILIAYRALFVGFPGVFIVPNVERS